jgi:polysaccharide biosynthesis transport protein
MTDTAGIQKHLIRDFVRGGGKELDITRYFHLLRRNLWLVALIVIGVLSATFVWLKLQQPQYASKAIVQVENEQQKVLGEKVEDVQPQNLITDDYYNTVTQSFTSETVMLRVARSVGLDKDPLIFPPKKDGKGYSDEEIAQKMLKRVSAELRKSTRLIDITVFDEQPERANKVCEAVLTEFVRHTVEQQYNVSRLASDFLQDEASKLKTQLETAERQLQEYRERNDAVSLEKSENITLEKLKDLNTALTTAKDTRLKLESDLEQLKRTRSDNVAGMLQIASVQAIPEVTDLQAQIAAAQAGLRQLLTTDLAALKKPQRHPKYIKATAAIDQLNDSLKATLQSAGKIVAAHYKAAKDTEDKLTVAFHEQEQAALDLNRIGIPYGVLQREVESDRTMYDSLMNRVRETTISAEIKASPFRVVQAPITSARPAKPEKPKMMLVALVFSMVLAGIVLVALDTTDDTLRSVDQAEEFLGVPALGVIPEEKPRKGARLPLVVVDDPSSRQAEAFRFIRASISLLGPEPSRRAFLMTSAVSDEGKSFSAMNTAAAFAIEGLRTIAVEADLRRPTFYKVWPEIADKNTPGLGDYLAENQPLEAVIRQSPVENLSFIFAGKSVRNPAELLTAKSFNRLILSLLERFDRVICDTAPINAVSDTLTLIGAVHYVCLVIRPGKTPKKAISRACDLISKAGGKIAGLLLNRVNFKIGAGYCYYYYGEKYVVQKA